MTKWWKRIGIGFGALCALLALLALDYVRSFQRSVPIYDGMLSVASPGAALEIVRDRYAVPHILAETFADAAYGLGYAHAQDRLWQMELSRRFVQGRLSERFGARTLGADIETRTLGLYAAAEEAVRHLTPETRDILERYADGVNAFLAHRTNPLPIEFALAGNAPEPWRPADSVAVIKGMAMTLSGNAGAEAARVQLLSILGKFGVESFLSPTSNEPLPAYIEPLFGAIQVGDAFGIPNTSASNNWVVGGARSATGKPLLANDPHLGFTIPSTWYLAHLATPDQDLVGGTLPGVPVIIAGRNRHVAWGITNTGADTQDLYVERIRPDDPRAYQTPGGWAPFEARVETIAVRFGATKEIVVRSSRHGPIVSDDPESRYAQVTPPGHAIALAWTALSPDDTTLDALLAINRAGNADAIRAAARLLVSPMQNLVFADDSGEEGRIGLVLPGRVPLRGERNDSLGLVPAPGWELAYDWQGTIPPDAMAEIVDPASGILATANNKTVPDGYPYAISLEWDAPYRHRRIEALLAATSNHDVESFRRIQLDFIDTYALALKSRLATAGPFEGTAQIAAKLVAAWDGAMERGRPEPLIFAAWARALSPQIYADELGDSFPAYWGYREDFTLRVLDNADGWSRWCDVRATPQTETCGSRIGLALDEAVLELSEAFGPDPNAWRWGDAHLAVHTGRPFGDFPLIGGWFNRENEMDGGPFTVLRADHRMRSDRPYAAVHGAGYRGIYDLEDGERSLYMISTGQSGNLFSPHYDDLLPLWAEGGYITIPTARDTILSEAAHRLTLSP